MEITKDFKRFIAKFYSLNSLKNKKIKQLRLDLSKATTEEDLTLILKELSTKETIQTLLDLYYDLKADEAELNKEEGKKLNEELKEISGAVILQLTLKNRRSATEIIVKEFTKNHKIYTTLDDIKPEMWIYKDGIYIPEGRSLIKAYCRLLLGEVYTTTLANEVIAKIEADTGIEPDDFFKQEYLNELPVQNGILNIITLELTPFTEDKIFFNKLPVSYDPEAKCPLIDQFLNDVLLNPDDKKVFYELAGFALRKEYTLEKAMMFVGDGRNGKSKSIELLKRLVGIENCSSLPLNALVPTSFSISELFGKLLNLAGDLSSTDLKETGMFKSLTGRDIISAQRKFLRNITFTNYAKLVFACNELPKVRDSSPAFWERWVLLEFPYKFVDGAIYQSATEEEKKMWKIKDTEIINKITTPEEMSGFLNKALKGLHHILKHKKFSYSVGTNEVKNKWIRKSDSFMAFCLDNIEESYDSRVSKQRIRKLYSQYCKKHKVNGCSDYAIKVTLQNNYGVTDDFVTEFGVGEQKHCWIGIKLKKVD